MDSCVVLNVGIRFLMQFTNGNWRSLASHRASIMLYAEPTLMPRYTTNAGEGECQGNAFGKVDSHLGMDQAPVLPPSGPFFRNIHHGRIQHFQRAVIGGKDGFCLI